MGGFQPSQSYGVQGFAPQQGQVMICMHLLSFISQVLDN